MPFRYFVFLLTIRALAAQTAPSPIRFSLQPIPFRLENDQSPARNAPESMPGGVAVFDYNRDGRPDIFFTNGANIATLKKDAPKFRNRLFRNDGKGAFTDVTDAAGLAGTGYDTGVAVGDYDNDGFQDLFVAGVHRNTLYRNTTKGSFEDVTAKAGLSNTPDAQFGPLWAITGGWFDANSDGLLDLFIVNYLQWTYRKEPLCAYEGKADFCHPRLYKGLPNQLLLNKGDGTFQDVSAKWGLRAHVGKGMGVGIADYDRDGKLDLFVPNDALYNFLFHNQGANFEEVGLPANVALVEDGNFISGMGLDFRDFNNDGYPDIAYVALHHQTFPLLVNVDGKEFKEITAQSGLRTATWRMAGFGAGFYDFDQDGWKDLFVTRGHVSSLPPPDSEVDQHNTVFRNPGLKGKWQPLTAEAGLTAAPPSRHRGCAFADLDGDGSIDIVTTALMAESEIWLNQSPGKGNWLAFDLQGVKSNRDGIGAEVKVTTKAGDQYNIMTTSVGYASSSAGPVHFGLGSEKAATAVEIRWPSGVLQKLTNVQANQILKVKESAR